MLWSFLLIIPGIVKAYSYAAAPYIFLEDPSKGISQCIDESRQLMDGKKMELFLLQLSFLPNELLVLITFGIYGFYLVPYSTVTFSLFMSENVLKGNVSGYTNSYSFDDEPAEKFNDTSTNTSFDDDFGSRIKETPKETMNEQPVENEDKFASLVDSIKEGLDSSKDSK